ncbi:MAG TPA: DNA ligase D [Xanthomonadaceae bacterium]|nr:DNA ligase D [Xanthomonadaceae bacterium]
MSLREYVRKRRFDATPEPSGHTPGARNGRRPIYVIQLHHARARHYDFRLEMDGTLKSWAVPRGPSLRVGEKRLAVEVEDHPLSYASFEGDIPEGNYGAGHVDIFDHGVWSSAGDPLEGMAAGKLDFSLHGEKLHGAWKLVRTQQQRGGKPQWLLIKRDDPYARDADADALMGSDERASTERAMAKKGGAAAKSARKALAATAPGKKATKKTAAKKAAAKKATAKRGRRRVDWAARAAALPGAKPKTRWKPLGAQLATLKDAAPIGDDWLHELKWDGYRLLVDIADGRVRLRSRNGLNWTEDYPDIVAAFEALRLDDASFDGELVALDPSGRDDFSLLQRTIEGSANAALRYMVFDLTSLAGHDLTGCALLDRKTLLEEVITGVDPVVAYSQHIVGHGPDVFAASAKQGMEGIISKQVKARYVPGRGTSWLKVKHALSDEFIVVGYTAPKRSRTGFGALLMATREHGALKYAGRVGTGYDDATLRSLRARMKPLERKAPTLVLPAHLPEKPRDVTWIEPELVAEVEYRGLGKEGLLRHPSFKGLREDKTVDDIGDATPAPALRITSPDKLIYPELKITKRQVVEYYRAVAPALLPEIENRPLSLVRCPDGVKGQCFFQKHHARTLGEHVRSVPIREKDGGSEDYVYVDSVEGLLDLVQMNVLEFHPWGSRIEDVERPDRLVFDLDPGEGVDWTAIKAAARDIRARLAEIGLQGFLRLSGGKGLHVVLPVKPEQDWTQAKAFCEAFADAMAAQAPDKYVATASKAKRRGVIFIDWLRNGRGATSVASWSLRARPQAGVAVPLAWSELGRVKSGHDYPLERALRRLAGKREDPWVAEGWGKATQQKLVELG